jgi:hypothetical protein
VNRTAPRSNAIRTVAVLAALAVLVAVFASIASADADAATAARKSAADAAKPVYDVAWKRTVSAKNKRWARAVASCESGNNPNALGAGGLYRGAFQFQRSTWRTAPRSPGGDPIRFSYRTQAFVAVRLKMSAGASPWPNCG